MKRRTIVLAALSLLPIAAMSADTLPLDDELLEYLSEFEDDDDNWTWFADDESDSKTTETTDKKPVTTVRRDQPALRDQETRR